MRRIKIMQWILAMIACWALWGLGAAQAMEVSIQPQAFEIGTFYNGTTLNVEGRVAVDQDVVVRFVGVPDDLHLKKKGKVLGCLWMNRGSLEFHDFPNVFLLYLPKPWDALGQADANDPHGIWTLGLEGLESRVSMEPEGEDKHLFFQELLKLKRKEGLYRQNVGSIAYGPEEQGARTFRASLQIPARLSEGDYHLEVYAVSQGRIVDSASVPIRARLVGTPAFIKKMAFQHALWHGILATLVAIVGGLLMGFIFGAGKGAH
ncbi:conserved hypothetical protein [Desulfacinum hydrothermale DSM 13146]|uniref:Transmembrane protein (Alph_Pro_TM) n=1 Tax=Desulfacinum hydrothermale DSM 13146 TaxID=1121390 RepID=A0A1W1WY20_9BACT|nr:TIGR02186 family protein [Desulfacinum hydrothermale]SMC16507.1 conserved hypothetical protein [Desulfacinum hydrothermale DSM 13146]